MARSNQCRYLHSLAPVCLPRLPCPLQASKPRSRLAAPPTPAPGADAGAAAAATPQPAAQQAQQAQQRRGGGEEGEVVGRKAATRQVRQAELAWGFQGRLAGLSERTFYEQLAADKLSSEPAGLVVLAAAGCWTGSWSAARCGGELTAGSSMEALL